MKWNQICRNLTLLTLSVFTLFAGPAQAAPVAVLSAVVGTGHGTIAPNENGKSLIVGKTYVIKANPGVGCTFSNWVEINGTNVITTNNSKLTFVMAAGLQLTANFRDVAPPVVKITTKSGTTSNADYLISGTAVDNSGVASVWYTVGASGPSRAASVNGFTNWSAPVLLAPGENTIQVYALDAAGNQSKTVSVTIKNTASGLAPEAVTGLSLSLMASGNRSAILDFGDSTLTKVGSGPSVSSGAGIYTYTVMGPDTAVLVDYSSLQSDVDTNSESTFTLTFTSGTNGTWTNDDAVSGTFTLSMASATAPDYLSGLTVGGMDTGTNNYAFTNQYGDGTYVETNSETNSSGSYIYQQFSPTGGMITTISGDGGGGNETNYILVVFSDDGSNQYVADTVEGTNTVGESAGVFTVSGTLAKDYTGPATLTGLNGAATMISINGKRKSFTVAASFCDFGQFTTVTNQDAGVGLYSFTRTGPKTAIFLNTYLFPPEAAANDGQEVVPMYFANSKTANFTNSDGHGTITFSTPARTVAPSLVGKSLTGHNHGGGGGFSFGYGAFTGVAGDAGESGTYTYSVYGPQLGLVVLNYTDSDDLGTTEYLAVWFSSATSGSFIEDSNSGKVESGTFTMK
jgi:hypothetical protein